MSGRPVTVIVSAPVTKINQGYGLDRTYRIDCGPRDVPPATSHKVRIDIERNAFDFQSHYLAKVWSGTAWEVVARIAPEDPSVTSLPSYVCFTMTDRCGECVRGVEEVARRLLAAAEAVLYSAP